MDLEPTLTGANIVLEPMRHDHRAGMLRAAADGALWKLRVTTVPDAVQIDDYIGLALAGREAGHMIPFVIKVEDVIVGSTRFWKLDARNRKAEIGYSWIASSWQRSFVNTEAKLLMLCHAFEALDFVRVQFQTDELNSRSRRAIARLGAVEEGVLRNERIMPDGRIRNSVRYSIIDAEWPAVRARLMERIAAYRP